MSIGDVNTASLALLVDDLREQLDLAPGELRYSGLESWPPGEGLLVHVEVFGRPSSVGFAEGTDLEDVAARLGAEIQDLVLEENWGEARPTCTGHPHPLSATVMNGVAVWHCPAGEGAPRPIRVRSAD
jgi:hypothetical protein